MTANNKKIDLNIGDVFGYFTVISKDPDSKENKYLVKCKCEKIKSIYAYQLNGGNYMSCGCKKKEYTCDQMHTKEVVDKFTKSRFDNQVNKLITSGKSKEDALEFVTENYRLNQAWKGEYSELDFEIYKKFAKQNCAYCDSPPLNELKSRRLNESSIYVNGLDRVDNSKNHSEDNVVTCCKFCNSAKRDRDIDDYLSWINKLYFNINSNGLNLLTTNKDVSDKFLSSLDLEKLKEIQVEKKNILIPEETDQEKKYRESTNVENLIGQKFNMLTPFALHNEKWQDRVPIWKCICNCGKKVNINRRDLKSGNTKSCGCFSIKNKDLPQKVKALHAYRIYKDGNISFEQFYNLSQMPCFYCGEEKVGKTPGSDSISFTYNGLDRIDNNLGHVINNIVTCCKHCNYAKLDRSYNDFINWVGQVFNHINNTYVKFPVKKAD